MPQPYTGGWACGAIRYSTPHAPVFQNHYQRRDCQRRSGSGHGSSLTFAAGSEMTLCGEASTGKSSPTAATSRSMPLCPVCGTPVYLRFAAMPELIAALREVSTIWDASSRTC